MTSPFIAVEGLRKSFGGVEALKGVAIDIRAGEVHGLVGANGAGKSTLIRILAGDERPNAGTIAVDGVPTAIADPQHATALGLSFIHQELNLVPRLTALENIVLGMPKPARLGLVDWKRVRAQVAPVAARVGIDFPLDREVQELSTAKRWLVSICRALVRRARLIVMDEPTASLSAQESERLFQIVRDLSRDGVAVLYVSHRLDEILDLCHRVTAFRDGRLVMEVERAGMTRRGLIEAIVGDAVETPMAPRAEVLRGPAVLSVAGLARGRAVRGVDLVLHRGEVLGLAGLVGAGRSEVVRMIFGADRPDAGTMVLSGAAFAPASPADAMRRGIGLVPEERRSEGLILHRSVAFNLSLTTMRQHRLVPGLPLLSGRRRAAWAEEMARRLTVKTPSVDTPVQRLSGGNQQKVVVGKWLGRPDLRVLILDEPSRGVDVGARAQIHGMIRDLARGGLSVIVVSSEAEELPGLCDRILVMAEGRIVEELTGSAITRQAIVQASYHGAGQDRGAA